MKTILSVFIYGQKNIAFKNQRWLKLDPIRDNSVYRNHVQKVKKTLITEITTIDRLLLTGGPTLGNRDRGIRISV